MFDPRATHPRPLMIMAGVMIGNRGYAQPCYGDAISRRAKPVDMGKLRRNQEI